VDQPEEGKYMIISRTPPKDGELSGEDLAIITNPPPEKSYARAKVTRASSVSMKQAFVLMLGCLAVAVFGIWQLVAHVGLQGGQAEDNAPSMLMALLGTVFTLMSAIEILSERRIRKAEISSDVAIAPLDSPALMMLAVQVGCNKWDEAVTLMQQDNWIGHQLLSWVELYVDCVDGIDLLTDEASGTEYADMSIPLSMRLAAFTNAIANEIDETMYKKFGWSDLLFERSRYTTETGPRTPMAERVRRLLDVSDKVVV
jgi:hypothetical protein